MWQSIISIILSGTAFALLHSALASRAIKLRCYRLGLSPRGYRLGYVVIALLTTALWLAYVHHLPDTVLYTMNGLGRLFLTAMQLCGLSLVWLSLRPIDVAAFLGLRSFANNEEPFIEQGIYRYLRHPMYSGFIVIIYAMPEQSINSLALYTLVTLYFVIGSRLEERRMMACHAEYSDYRRRVPAFIPYRLNIKQPGS